MKQHTNEQKHCIQSAHNVSGLPKMKTMNNTFEKISFNGDQHKYLTQIPNYYSPKHFSPIEIFSKKYTSPISLHNSTGLLWYDANKQTVYLISYY
jgi:hypothetical protein